MASKRRSAEKGLALAPYNAAPEWQAEGVSRRGREPVVACPLEGLVILFLPTTSIGSPSCPTTRVVYN